jgi:hypothetical protein
VPYHRSASPETQTKAFKNIVELTTRYPVLRRIFLRSPDIKEAAGSLDVISKLWMSDDDCDADYSFALQFAAFCLADNDSTACLEDIRPGKLGCPSEGDLSVVTRLSVRYCE